jgi:site-specific recombinase XerD
VNKSVQRIFDDFSTLLRQESSNNNRFPYSEVSLYKSAVNSLINMAFNLKVSESYANRWCTKGFKITHSRAPKYKNMWSIEVMLSYYRAPPLIYDNIKDQYVFLQTKTAALIMFSAFLRIHETTNISLDGIKLERECIWVQTVLKSRQKVLTPIAIPFFSENPAICPASTVLDLMQANKDRFGKSLSILFVDWNSSSPLTTSNVSELLRHLFKSLGLPKEFGPYTIKHAVITYLTNRNVKMEEINDIAHFAKRVDDSYLSLSFIR